MSVLGRGDEDEDNVDYLHTWRHKWRKKKKQEMEDDKTGGCIVAGAGQETDLFLEVRFHC